MRRGRDIRNYRDGQIHRPKVVSKHVKSKKTSEPIENTEKVDAIKAREEIRVERIKTIILRRKEHKQKVKTKTVRNVIKQELVEYDFVPTDKYTYSGKSIKICHLIDSLGLGGSQIMMLELSSALDKYYGNSTKNIIVSLSKSVKKYDSVMYQSYGITPTQMQPSQLKEFISTNEIDVVIHHRTAHARCVRKWLPKKAIYILVNHTWNNLGSIRHFTKCDYYISVCKFLSKRTNWSAAIPRNKITTILNGIENDFLDKITPQKLDGTFNTGRCHRLAGEKFKIDSLTWMEKKATNQIPGFRHYLIGFNSAAKALCRSLDSVKYLGSITDRDTKFSYIRAFDVYFYETFQNEGASIALLEALACGVPVVCKPLGGNPELIKDGFNGFLVNSRSEMMDKMVHLTNPEILEQFKRQCIEDFNSRLHIKNTASKYMQVIESCLKSV